MARGMGGTGLTALRAALGAVAGGLEGYTQLQADQRKRQMEEAMRQRQGFLDAQNLSMQLAGLKAQGWETPDEVQRQQTAARSAIGSSVASALNMASGGAPLPSMGSLDRAVAGYATARPDRQITLGGVPLTLRETPQERQDRLIRTQAMQERQASETEQRKLDQLVTTAIAKGAKSPEALRLALQKPEAYKAFFEDANAITPYQKASLDLQRQGLSLREKELTSREKQQQERVPVTDKKNMNELASTVKELHNAMNAAEGDPSAFGVKTLLPNFALSRIKGEQGTGVRTRATINSSIMKVRRTEFGTAQSESEKKSGVASFPSEGDDTPTVVEKLSSLRDKALLELNTKREFYGLAPLSLEDLGFKANSPARATSGAVNPYR